MAVYTINDIASITGIKPHTLRTWEKRYGLEISRRSPANVRYYLDEDLKRIINISILNKGGMKISKIAELSWSEIRKLATEKSDVHHSHETILDSLSLSLINLDQDNFDRIITIHEEQGDFTDVLRELIFPLFEKMNSMYLTGTIKPMHESFFNYMIKGKILSQIDRLRQNVDNRAPEFMLFQPQRSNEELGAMLLNYYLVEASKSVLNLGSHIEPTDVIQAYEIQPTPYIVGLFNAELSEKDIERYIQQILQHCPNSTLILSGFDIYRAGIEEHGRLKVLPDLQGLLSFLKEKSENGVLA